MFVCLNMFSRNTWTMLWKKRYACNFTGARKGGGKSNIAGVAEMNGELANWKGE